MWCDNYLLIFPLGGGTMAQAMIIAIYSFAGSLFLFLRGALLYFTYPEPQIYGGIGMGVVAICVISLIAISNKSLVWARVVAYLSPFVLIIVAVRAGLMVFRLDYYQSYIIWECDHGGQQYLPSAMADPTYNYQTATNALYMPSGFCSSGFHTVYLAFAFALCVDFIMQTYLYFLMWRFNARLLDYIAVEGKQLLSYQV